MRHLEKLWDTKQHYNLPRTSQHHETPQGIPEIPKYRHKERLLHDETSKNTKRHQDFMIPKTLRGTRHHEHEKRYYINRHHEHYEISRDITRHHEKPEDTKGSLRYHHETPWDTTRQATMKHHEILWDSKTLRQHEKPIDAMRNIISHQQTTLDTRDTMKHHETLIDRHQETPLGKISTSIIQDDFVNFSVLSRRKQALHHLNFGN